MAKARSTQSIALSAAIAAALGTASISAQAADTDVSFGGYVKLDLMVSDYTDGQAPASGSIAR
ncbi:Secreted protein of porin family protein, partial [Idiomarina baltica OS145]